MVALTRYGQSRAVAEGVPMLLWIDEQQGRFGLEAERSYLEDDDHQAKEYQLSEQMRIEVTLPVAPTSLVLPWKGADQARANQRVIRFNPDGFISETSPEYILLLQLREEVEEGAVLIGRSRSRLHYEIQTNHLALMRR